MSSSKKRTVVVSIDLARPIRSHELVERLLDGTPSLATTVVKTEKGPLLVYRYRERTFVYLHDLIDHLKSTGILDGEALEAT